MTRFVICYITACSILAKLKEYLYMMFFFRMNCLLKLLLLNRPKYLVRYNGLMGIGVQIPIHEAIVFDFGAAYADSFLEQYSSRIFFVGESLHFQKKFIYIRRGFSQITYVSIL